MNVGCQRARKTLKDRQKDKDTHKQGDPREGRERKQQTERERERQTRVAASPEWTLYTICPYMAAAVAALWIRQWGTLT